MSTPNDSRRPLAALRAMIDAIDRDMMQLLARRMAIVAEVADYKRDNKVRIRDLAREREILAERFDRAKKLGLPATVVESIFRLIMLASRDHQAALRAEVPRDVEPRTVAVIGGHGGMGRTMARIFEDLGHPVLVADLDTRITAVEAAKAADVVVISVPIDATEAVIREVGPHVREDGLLMDVTSIKDAPLKAMLESTKASVVGTHPMFGPGVHTMQNQRVVVCPGRGDAWLSWLREMLSARGLVVTDSTAEEHDRVMAVVQVLNHFQTQVLGLSLARFGIPHERTLEFTSPSYLLESYVAARHFAQSAALYGPIEMSNPDVAKATSTFERTAQELGEMIRNKDREAFEAVFDEVRTYFGDFTQEALEQSRFLVDRLVELTAGR